MSDQHRDPSDDPLDAGAGDLEEVARRYEAHLDAVGAEARLAEARADIEAGRTFPLADLRDRQIPPRAGEDG